MLLKSTYISWLFILISIRLSELRTDFFIFSPVEPGRFQIFCKNICNQHLRFRHQHEMFCRSILYLTLKKSNWYYVKVDDVYAN